MRDACRRFRLRSRLGKWSALKMVRFVRTEELDRQFLSHHASAWRITSVSSEPVKCRSSRWSAFSKMKVVK